MFDVASFHFFYERGLFGVGLPIFLLLTFALGADKSLEQVARRRAERLLVPWLFWSVAILVVRLLRMGLGAQDDYWHLGMLFYGPWDHLWFLPFAFAGSLLVAAVRPRGQPSIGSLLVCAVLAAAVIVAPIPKIELAPFHQWIFSLPALPLGLALGRVIDAKGGARHARKDAAILCAAALAAFVFVVPLAGGEARTSLFRYGLAFTALTAVLFLPDRADRFTRALTPLLLGVYLLHDPLYELGLKRLHLERWIAPRPVQALLLLALTAGLVWGLRRTPIRRFL